MKRERESIVSDGAGDDDGWVGSLRGLWGRGSSCPPATIHVRDENSSERMIYHQWSAIAILIYDINSQVVRPGSGSVLMDTIVALCVRVPLCTFVCVRMCVCVRAYSYVSLFANYDFTLSISILHWLYLLFTQAH